ncbi:Alpha-1 4 glucan phosphorylase [Fasciola gigantica]|uniref:Alpha-1,4 glucan phosphorylase n=1 Tax=Fasciola gigantica TaxID=46835 RepID=A0A504YEI9_FASGI|nr:Alpha-1 4 glucan phosphorylase [Fasciola gigantica]
MRAQAEAEHTYRFMHSYDPRKYITANPELAHCLEQIRSGYYNPAEPDLFQDIYLSLVTEDRFLICGPRTTRTTCERQSGKLAHTYRPPQKKTEDAVFRVIAVCLRAGACAYFSKSIYSLVRCPQDHAIRAHVMHSERGPRRSIEICGERGVRNEAKWSRMVLYNIAGAGRFSSDRTVAEYAREMWNVNPSESKLPPPSEPLEPKLPKFYIGI